MRIDSSDSLFYNCSFENSSSDGVTLFDRNIGLKIVDFILMAQMVFIR